MPQAINLKANELTLDEAKEILNFFEYFASLGIKYWAKNKAYEFNGKQFMFKNDVYQRQGKHGSRYEVISNKEPIGTGSSGVVRLIKTTFSMNGELFNFKKESNHDKSRRVVKVQDHIDERLEKEYQLSTRASHLGIKEPTIIDLDNTTRSFITMKRLPGKELYDIISEDIEGKKTLTLAQRVELSIALLRALKNQVSELDIIHRDIKPKNIIVDLGPPIQVNIIDYGISIRSDEPPLICKGSIPYMSPEVFAKTPTINVKSDVFSMGRVLALIWQGNNDTYSSFFKHLAFKFPPERLLDSLFDKLDNLEESFKCAVFNALKGMLELNPEERSTIDKAIDDFAAINIARLAIDQLKIKESSENFMQSTQLIRQLLGKTALSEHVSSIDGLIDLNEKPNKSEDLTVTRSKERQGEISTLSINPSNLFSKLSAPEEEKEDIPNKIGKQNDNG